MGVKRRNFPVQGMGCAACVARVENTLKACPGVSGVSVSLASNTAQVDYDPGQTSPAALQKAVRDAYAMAEKIHFEGVNYRHDIGLDLMQLQ